MRNRLWIWLFLLETVVVAAAARSAPPVAAESDGEWRQRSSLPDSVGFAGMLAGTSRGRLIAAGGANFPQAPPWEGGQKVWYDTVFVLDAASSTLLPEQTWRLLRTRLPRPLGYAVSVTHDDAVIVAGGESPTGTGSEVRREVFAIRWSGGDISLTPLPPLPTPLTNACGAMLGSRLYIAGGASSPTVSTKSFWSLDLAVPEDKRTWTEHRSWDGPPRMLAVAAVVKGRFYLLSGAELSASPDGKPSRRFLRDAHRFDPDSGWTRIADLPRAVVAAPSPAAVVNDRILVFGGDDGKQFLNPPQKHTGFPTAVLAYDAETDRWSEAGEIPAPRVTVPLVPLEEEWILISGERRPGIRSPEVWSFSPVPKVPK